MRIIPITVFAGKFRGKKTDIIIKNQSLSADFGYFGKFADREVAIFSRFFDSPPLTV